MTGAGDAAREIIYPSRVVYTLSLIADVAKR
jgi:hypothetical protein